MRSVALRDEWTRNPTLDDLDERAATISAPGSPDYEGLVALIRELVERGERLVPGEPDLNAATVEPVEISSETPDRCDRRRRASCSTIDGSARTVETVGDSGILSAIRIRQQVERTAERLAASVAIRVRSPRQKG